MDCAQVAREELLEKYLNGRLEPPLERDLQVHLLECGECAALLETYDEARDQLARQGAILSKIPEKQIRGAGWFSPWRVAVLAGLVIAVVVTGVVLRSRIIPRSGPQAGNGTNVSTGTVAATGNAAEANFPELAALPSAEKGAVLQAINNRAIAFPPDLAALRGKRGTLLGSSPEDRKFRVLEPVGEVAIDSRPVFRWQALAGAASYSVVVLDGKANLVASSPPMRATQWKPAQPLKRGQVYEWQVTAMMGDGTSAIAPSFPQPKAEFRVIDQAKADELEQFRKENPDAHLVLGILYAQAGLLKNAEQELTEVPTGTQDFDLAQHFLHSIRELR